MTTTPISDSQSQFGQTLAFAERTMSAVLRQHLAERRVEPETWYALKLIAGRSPRAPRDQLLRDLGGSRTLSAGSADEVLTRLETEGLIRGDAEVELTPDGERLYRDLHGYVSRPTARLIGRLDPGDIDTTVRTLQAITALAAEDLSAGRDPEQVDGRRTLR
jgi:DNA-binding MarR family transcriptional regulator